MTRANLFQLGTGLETGAHAEDPRDLSVADIMLTSLIPSTEAQPQAKASVLDRDRDDHFIRRDGVIFAGTHLIVEVENGHGLDDEARIQTAFRDCVTECGATLLHIHTHKFSPQGVSGVAVLAESHISVHTWPEIGYGAFDVFMCGAADPWKAVGVLKRAFATDTVHVKELRRGEGLVSVTAAA